MLDCSETARQSKHCGCTALCSCGAFSQWKLSKATPTKSTHCHFNFHTYHLTGSALLHIAVTYTVLLYLSNCEIWSNGDQILRFGQIYNFFWKPGDSVKFWNSFKVVKNFLPLNFTFLSKWGLDWICGWAFGQPLSPLRTIFSKAGVAYQKEIMNWKSLKKKVKYGGMKSDGQ